MPKLESYKSPKTAVKQKSISGKGLFASKEISKGEIVFIKTGHILSEERKSFF